jgi:hypothetical protein
MDAFLDKVEAVINFWNRIWDKVCDICRPTINFLSPYVMPVLIKIVNELLPLMERPVDWILFWYFACHIPITLFIDLQPIYPEWFIPKFFADVSASYIEILEDPFMDTTKPVKYWFQSFLFCEAFIQLPFFFFATYGVLKSKYLSSVVLEAHDLMSSVL